jgi:hypothetical protein
LGSPRGFPGHALLTLGVGRSLVQLGVPVPSLTPVAHPVLCLSRSNDGKIEAHFEDAALPSEFYVLLLEGPAPIQVGVHDGEPWYRWAWMWESTREADLALEKVPTDVESRLESAVASMREFVARCIAGPDDRHVTAKLDIAPLLGPIGWPMLADPCSKTDAARRLAIYRRLRGDRK